MCVGVGGILGMMGWVYQGNHVISAEHGSLLVDYNLAKQVTGKLENTFTWVDFLLYCLAGSKFRKDVQD